METKAKKVKKDIYLKKMQGCMILAAMNKKKITDEDIKVTSRQFEIPKRSLENGWKTFQESGGKYVDYRVKSGRNVNTTQFGKPKTKPCSIFNENITAKEAADILVEYMTTSITSRELSVKYEVALSQFYGWIRELDTSGTLMGVRVLDPKKYAKLVIKDVIWMKKNPETNRKSIQNLTVTERAAYARVAEVLLNYLPGIKVTNAQ